MADRVAAHAYVAGVCTHCGAGDHDPDMSCIWREAPPRPRPKSVFADLSAIGARRNEIKAEEDAARAGAAESATA